MCSDIKRELAESEEVETQINRMAELRNELQAILTEEKQEGVGGHLVFMYEVALWRRSGEHWTVISYLCNNLHVPLSISSIIWYRYQSKGIQ